MAMTTTLWSSPTLLGRPSSPLNPNSDRSSSPITSPTPYYPPSLGSTSASSSSTSKPHPLLPPVFRQRHSAPTRYTRPTSNLHLKRHSLDGGTGDLFAEGTTPMEGAMWRERFGRRLVEREKRKVVRKAELDKRRSVDRSDEVMDDDEADRRAQADDEEIFRRLMIMQRNRALHQQLVSHQVETGGSDPPQPDFWDEEIGQNLERYRPHWQPPCLISQETPSHIFQTPQKSAQVNKTSYRDTPGIDEDEEDRWAREAAEAEEAEMEVEAAEMARRVEEEYAEVVGNLSPLQGHGHFEREEDRNGNGMEMEWESFDAMDIE